MSLSLRSGNPRTLIVPVQPTPAALRRTTKIQGRRGDWMTVSRSPSNDLRVPPVGSAEAVAAVTTTASATASVHRVPQLTRDASRNDEGHDLGGLGVERLDVVAGHDDDVPTDVVRLGDVDRDMVRKPQLGESGTGHEPQGRDVSALGQRDDHGPVELLLLADERPDDVLEGRIDELDERRALEEVLHGGEDPARGEVRCEETDQSDRSDGQHQPGPGDLAIEQALDVDPGVDLDERPAHREGGHRDRHHDDEPTDEVLREGPDRPNFASPADFGGRSTAHGCLVRDDASYPKAEAHLALLAPPRVAAYVRARDGIVKTSATSIAARLPGVAAVLLALAFSHPRLLAACQLGGTACGDPVAVSCNSGVVCFFPWRTCAGCACVTTENGQTCLATASVPGAVPMLAVDKSTGSVGDLDLSWGASCTASGPDYTVDEGQLGVWYSHTPRACTSGHTLSMTLTPAAGDRYYLIAPIVDEFT